MSVKIALQNCMSTWASEEEKFAKGNASAGTRARAALSDMAKLIKQRRQEIQDAKNAVKEAKFLAAEARWQIDYPPRSDWPE